VPRKTNLEARITKKEILIDVRKKNTAIWDKKYS
jgi:hypothetical protein